MRTLVSVINITYIHFKMETKAQMNEARPKEQPPAKLSKPQPPDVIHPKIDVTKIKIRSTLQFRQTLHSIRIMVPVTQDTAWVAGYPDKRLTMINRDGDTIKKSVQLFGIYSSFIDAKQYNDNLLITCTKQHQVIRLSEDGGCKTTFSDMSPYYPQGLCITHAMDVLLCLKSIPGHMDQDVKVVRLNSNGDTIQTIQHDDKGNVMYSWPVSVTSLQSGEVIVCDRGQHMRVSCVNSEGHFTFKWGGEVQGEKEKNKFSPICITHDKYNNLFITDYNNDRLCVLSKDGTEAKCLIDSTQGIQKPWGITVDDQGQLWVGCLGGKIHIIEY